MKNRLLRAALGLSLSLVALPSAFAAPPTAPRKVQEIEGISEYRLPNGLQVLLAHDDSKPTVTVNLTVKAGSRMENYGETGMAHLLEHLMFKGTPKHPKVWAEFTTRGLAANGTTNADRTNYFASFAYDEANLAWYLGWLADALVNSNIARRDLDSEMTVVRNEMEQGENNATRVLAEKISAAAYQWHNYGKSTIGARADVENVDIPRLRAFYKLYYQPDNAVLIVTGRFDARKMLATVSRTFGKIPKPQRKLPRFYTLDPVQEGERTVILRRASGTPAAMVAYHLPAMSDPDYPALDLAAFMLGEVPQGRLHQRLVEKKLAAAVWGYAEDRHDPTLATFGAQLAPGQSPQAAGDALAAAVESVAAEPFDAEALQRTKTQWLNQWEEQFNDPQKLGAALSESVAGGDWRQMFLQRDRIESVTLADVNRVARQYFVRDNRTTGLFIPGSDTARAPAPRFVDVQAALAGYRGRGPIAKAERFDATPAHLDQRTQRYALANGMQVALLPKGTRGNTVEAALELEFGDEKSGFGQVEAARAAAALLNKGTAQRTRAQIAEQLDKLKATVRFSGGPNALTASIQSRRDSLPAVIALVAEMLREPALPAEAFDEYKRMLLADLAEQRKDPESVAGNAAARHGQTYARGDVRYFRSFDEKEQDIRALTLDQVRAFHRAFVGANHGRIAIVGDMDVPAVRAALEQAFARFDSTAPFARVPDPLQPRSGAVLSVATPDQQNAAMQVMQPLPVKDGDADHLPLAVAAHILGGGGNSRLWKRIREQDGLSYGVYDYIDWNAFDANSQWNAAAIFAPQNRDRVQAAFNEEIARALKDGFTQAELDEAKRSLLNYARLARAQDGTLAGMLLSQLKLGRDFAYEQRREDALAALPLAQVNDALRRHLDPSKFVFAFAGDFRGAR
jgi:zinc protease